MARQIRETPILYDNDARRFEERMKNPPKETIDERKIRLSHYHFMLKALQAGEIKFTIERKGGNSVVSYI